MIIHRFGATYAAAYQFPSNAVVDDFTTTRAPVAERVGGMGGAFDFYGTNNYPVQPLTIRKSFALTGIITTLPTVVGTVLMTIGSSLVNGIGASFLTHVLVNDTITITTDSGSQTGSVTLVSDDDHLYVNFSAAAAAGINPTYYIERTTTTKTNVETAINNLHAATVALGESLLWSLGRDGVKRWTYAKCTSLKTSEKASDVYSIDASLEFFCREGLWYSENATSTTFTHGTSYPLSVPTVGNYYSSCVFRVTPSNGTITSITVANATTGDTFTWAGTLANGKELLVNTGSYIVTNDGTGAYSGITVGANQINWLRLNPGANSVTITKNSGTATTWSGAIIRNDMYV
jgi:hypothetical protein